MRIFIFSIVIILLLCVVTLSASADNTVPPECAEPKMYYTDTDVEMLALTLWGECRGTKSTTIQSGVAWCVLNRYDSGKYGNTIADVISAPHQFAGYQPNRLSEAKKSSSWNKMMWLAEDVLIRWNEEHNGFTEVIGRTLPKDYKYFRDMYDGNGNIFFNTWNTERSIIGIESKSTIWRWTLGNPYEEDVIIHY